MKTHIRKEKRISADYLAHTSRVSEAGIYYNFAAKREQGNCGNSKRRQENLLKDQKIPIGRSNKILLSEGHKETTHFDHAGVHEHCCFLVYRATRLEMLPLRTDIVRNLEGRAVSLQRDGGKRRVSFLRNRKKKIS